MGFRGMAPRAVRPQGAAILQVVADRERSGEGREPGAEARHGSLANQHVPGLDPGLNLLPGGTDGGRDPESGEGRRDRLRCFLGVHGPW